MNDSPGSVSSELLLDPAASSSPCSNSDFGSMTVSNLSLVSFSSSANAGLRLAASATMLVLPGIQVIDIRSRKSSRVSDHLACRGFSIKVFEKSRSDL